MTALPSLYNSCTDEEVAIFMKAQELSSLELNFEQACELTHNLISKDCWAVVIDGEELFNMFNYSRSVKETIQQDMLKDHISKNSCIPSFMLISMSSNCTCEMYMRVDAEHTWKLVIELDKKSSKAQKWTVSIFGKYPFRN